MSHIDKRIQVNTIIENQLPDFVLDDFPNAVEFLKQYYISQEFQGGPSDLISNFDQYLKSDNLVPEVVVGVTTTSAGISTTDGVERGYGVAGICTFTRPETLVPYNDLTESQVAGWIATGIGTTSIATMKVEIDKHIDPNIGGTPW